MEAQEAEHETCQPSFRPRAGHQSAVVLGGQEEVRGHYFQVAAGPDDALDRFDLGQLLRGVDDADGGSRHVLHFGAVLVRQDPFRVVVAPFDVHGQRQLHHLVQLCPFHGLLRHRLPPFGPRRRPRGVR